MRCSPTSTGALATAKRSSGIGNVRSREHRATRSVHCWGVDYPSERRERSGRVPVTNSSFGDSKSMTYDEKLAERIRRVLPPRAHIVEQKMFGGLAFLLDAKMFVGVTDKDLMVRVGPDAYAAAVTRPHVRPMDFTGRPLKGFIFVSAIGARTDNAVAAWVRQALKFVGALPA